MIVGKIHPGSGLGDSLFTYILTRVIALDCGYEFGFVGKEYFKGSSFLKFMDWGKTPEYTFHIENPAGKLIIDQEHDLFIADKQYYDPEVNFIGPNTVIDGYGAQDQRYFQHRIKEISEWLAVEAFQFDEKNIENVCILNFRGGEFVSFPDLFLTRDYWQNAMKIMLEVNADIKFEVHTNDAETARLFFPDLPIYQRIDLNWRAIKNAKYVILSNSAFGIMPALLNQSAKLVIAPRYWARRNTKEWSTPQNYYDKFMYI